MAEIAAGALVVEQVVSTGVQAAAVATVAKPTQLLKASLSQIASTSGDDNSLELARSHHTVTVIGNKAYIFGGESTDGQLSSTDIHAIAVPSEGQARDIDYACYPAVAAPNKDAATDTLGPVARTGHAACARRTSLIIHGGRDKYGNNIDDGSSLWAWDSQKVQWARINTKGDEAPAPRSDHHIFFVDNKDMLILHGGKTKPGQEEDGSQYSDTWLFDFAQGIWTQLPSSPGPSLNAALVDETLYCIGAESNISGSVHSLKINAIDKALQWSSVDFPTSPLTPGPRSRTGSGLIAVTTGYGRNYLVYFFGSGEGGFFSDAWSLQLPSDGLSASSIKDTIRDNIPGVDSGSFTWSEMDIAPAEPKKADGKAHPGPRGFFGADSCGGKGVVFWGGINAKGETESDGWLLKLA
ncbi:hypothetical protein AK830_g4058 [Neonectria ditissima]|uniref:Uncharacterized protein n=1 Tax=Neonectria ditissima TaxID=78410 RepID=A0A0P7BNU9_9HYPO|nr:hypothetical protein AK830_g4058 [Neonectria ditissima]